MILLDEMPRTLQAENEVRAIYAACHPGWPDRRRSWYFAHPTLVAEEDGHRIVAHASFTLNPTTATLYLMDTCVLPSYRGQGIARRLMVEREAHGRALGAKIFVGCTWAENVAIIKIHDALGYHACQRVPGYFKHNDPPADGIIYIKAEG